MNKEELIHVHGLLDTIKKEALTDEAEERVNKVYKPLCVPPNSVHKSKEEHKNAIHVLSQEIAEHINFDALELDGKEDIKDTLQSARLYSSD